MYDEDEPNCALLLEPDSVITISSLSTIPVTLYVPQVTKNVLEGLEHLPLTKTLVQTIMMPVSPAVRLVRQSTEPETSWQQQEMTIWI